MLSCWRLIWGRVTYRNGIKWIFSQQKWGSQRVKRVDLDNWWDGSIPVANSFGTTGAPGIQGTWNIPRPSTSVTETLLSWITRELWTICFMEVIMMFFEPFRTNHNFRLFGNCHDFSGQTMADVNFFSSAPTHLRKLRPLGEHGSWMSWDRGSCFDFLGITRWLVGTVDLTLVVSRHGPWLSRSDHQRRYVHAVLDCAACPLGMSCLAA